MTLTRKTRASGSSIVVTIPSQLVEAYGISSGDTIEITPLKNGEISINVASGDIDGLTGALCQAIATKLMQDEEFQEELMDMLEVEGDTE